MNMMFFFSLFETISEERNWPRSIRIVMLQTVITGKAQEAYAALTMEDRKDYGKVKVDGEKVIVKLTLRW